MTVGERGRSIAPTCQDVSLEFKCILFNRWSFERAFQPFRSFELFSLDESAQRRALFSLSDRLPPLVLLRILVNYMRLPPAVLHDSTLLRRSLFSQFKRWTRRLFRMRIKSVQEAEPCFQVRPAGKETAEYSCSTSVGRFCQNTLVRTLTLLRFAADSLFNKSLINKITRRSFFGVVINVRREKEEIY